MKYVTQLLALLPGLSMSVTADPTPPEPDILPDIVVTADYRSAKELQSPTSISVITEEVIAVRGAQHFEDIIGTIPNVNFASGTNRARFFQIRGIGERSQFEAPLNPSVGLIIDNVDYSGAGTAATLMDVEQIEIMRGPQGTRYGANALAGLINIKTLEPQADFNAVFKLGAAQYGTSTTGAMITGSASAVSQFRVAAEKHVSDGYYENDFLGKDDTNGRDEFTLRGKLAMAPGDHWDLLFSLNLIEIDNGYDAFNLDNLRHTISDEPGHDRQDTVGFSVDSSWHLASTELQVIAGLLKADSEYGYDEDWTFTGFHPRDYTSTDNYIRNRDSLSFELRLISTPDNRLFNHSTDWVAGVYTLQSRENLRREYTYLSSDFLSDYDFDTYALFVQLDSDLTETLALQTGLRLEHRSTRYQDSDGVAFTPEEKMWGGRIALMYSLNASTMSYISVARGYKAGGFNTDGTLEPDLREYDDEYLVEVEAGVKSRMMKDRLQLRLAAFYDDRRDQQVNSSLLRSRPDGTTEFVDFFGNAAEGTNKGLEIETNWYAADNLKLTAAVGLLKAEFDRFINEKGEDLSGRDQSHAPSQTWHVAADYRNGNFHMNLSVDGKDEFFFSDGHAIKSKGYNLVNAAVGYDTESWGIRVWARNLTNEDYYTRAFGSFSNDPRDLFDFVEPYFQYGEPRIAGITVEFSIGD